MLRLHARHATALAASLCFVQWVAAAFAAEPQDVVFTAALDKSEQRYVVLLPEGFRAEQPHSLLIALHGHGSDRWQFVKDGRDECRAARDVAAEQGMIFVSPDYRAKTSWMGPAAEADLVQILGELRTNYRIDKVIVSGGSMGGTAALTFAALHPELVDGVVAMNGTANLVEYDQFQDAIAASYGGTKAEKLDEYQKRSAELHSDRLTMPLALTTGGKDRLVPADSVLRLAEQLKKQGHPVASIHRPEGGHDTKYADAKAAFNFVIKNISAPPRPLLTLDGGPATVVCLGDSVTGVYYHTGGRRAYPELLELALRMAAPHGEIKVVNAGISGQTTTQGLARLDRDVLSHKPQLVTISFGLNDMTRLSEEQFAANLEALVTRCRDAKSQVLLCTPNAVLETAARPIKKLRRYCEVIRQVGSKLNVPVCDQFGAGEALRKKDGWAWRLTMSDEIHPNLDGHKRMAEELARSIMGKEVSLAALEPPTDFLSRTKQRLKQQQPVKVLAMPPFDRLVEPALRTLAPDAKVEVTAWPTDGKPLAEIEQTAKSLVRAHKPDLVIIAVPASAVATAKETTADEEFARSFAWIMNWSLSFGQQEWDCVVIHPCVVAPEALLPRSDLIRQLVRAQDLTLIDRPAGNRDAGEMIFQKTFNRAQ